MERLTRLIGFGLLVGTFAWSVGYYQQTLNGITPEPVERPMMLDAVQAAASSNQTSADVTDDDPYAPPPRYLSFSEGFEAGIYAVSDLPTSRDRDVAPSTRGVDRSYPVETDLVPEFSLATGGQLAPGLYATAFGVRDCSYEIRRVNKSRVELVIGEDRLLEGRMLVTINEIEPDTFVSMPQCGDWVRWSPLVEPLTSIGNGDYWVGDLEMGTWTVPSDCVWEKVVGFRGAELADVQESGIGPRPLEVDEDTLGVRIRGCSANLVLESQ